MMKALILGFALAVAGCASITAVGRSPEAQIANGAATVTAVTITANKLLSSHVISVTQAKSYRNMLAAAGEALKDANTELLACRKDTGSTAETSPDPCWPKVADVVTIALENVVSVKRAVDSK